MEDSKKEMVNCPKCKKVLLHCKCAENDLKK